MIPIHITIQEASDSGDAVGFLVALMGQFATIPDVQCEIVLYSSKSFIFLLLNL